MEEHVWKSYGSSGLRQRCWEFPASQYPGKRVLQTHCPWRRGLERFLKSSRCCETPGVQTVSRSGQYQHYQRATLQKERQLSQHAGSSGCPFLNFFGHSCLIQLLHDSGNSFLLQFCLQTLTSAQPLLQLHSKIWLKYSQFPLFYFCNLKKCLMFSYQKVVCFFFLSEKNEEKEKKRKADNQRQNSPISLLKVWLQKILWSSSSRRCRCGKQLETLAPAQVLVDLFQLLLPLRG